MLHLLHPHPDPGTISQSSTQGRQSLKKMNYIQTQVVVRPLLDDVDYVGHLIISYACSVFYLHAAL